jgi:hypothetical protein
MALFELTEAKVKLLTALCGLLAMLASWLGIGKFQLSKESQAKTEQITTIANEYHYHYKECDK